MKPLSPEFTDAIVKADLTNDMREQRAWLHAARNEVNGADIDQQLQGKRVVMDRAMKGPTKSQVSGLGSWSVSNGVGTIRYEHGVEVEPGRQSEIYSNMKFE